MKILLTGSKGYVGSHLLQHLKAHQVYTIDKSDGNDLVTCDLNYDVDLVIHLAAESHVDKSISNPNAFVLNNIVGTTNLLEVLLESL